MLVVNSSYKSGIRRNQLLHYRSLSDYMMVLAAKCCMALRRSGLAARHVGTPIQRL